MHESEKWKRSCSVVSDSQRPQGLQPTRLLCPWDFPGKSTGVGCHCLLRCVSLCSCKPHSSFTSISQVNFSIFSFYAPISTVDTLVIIHSFLKLIFIVFNSSAELWICGQWVHKTRIILVNITVCWMMSLIEIFLFCCCLFVLFSAFSAIFSS